jgi:hypothetical protein
MNRTAHATPHGLIGICSEFAIYFAKNGIFIPAPMKAPSHQGPSASRILPTRTGRS